ncbi:ATP-binding protein [Frankia sp. Cppng1_Ct_nod]|uniref:ATP-binding protein n=1 Tax=Frankia sp. Cppng1_Ct_nod TaxID=2897162 RepID=UPI0013EF6AE3|nr:ATP-binding protein [Frankia sp. Cppng1_Ct_nod]
MTSVWHDPRREEASRALVTVHGGVRAADVETGTLDFKEDQSRRVVGGLLTAGATRHEPTARDLAEAACCFANAHGGVVIVGVDDRAGGPAAFVGTSLDPEWLRHRIWELTDPHLAVDIETIFSDGGERLLVIVVSSGLTAHKVSGGRYKHRVGAHCVEMLGVDHAALVSRYIDWSAEPTTMRFADVDFAALLVARQVLRATEEPGRVALASRSDEDLLRALGVLDPITGTLTRAGALLFTVTDRGRSHLDYIRRVRPGADAQVRVDEPGRSLLVEFNEVEISIRLANQRVHAVRLGARGIGEAIPRPAAREALVNAIMHRDWTRPEPITIEHLGDQLVVTSPGRFPHGVDTSNVLTTTSRPTNPHLANVMRSLRLAEREAIGVDRMYREMILLGHRPPVITQTVDAVRCVLIGGSPVEPVTDLTSLLSDDARADVDIVLIIYWLSDHPRVDAGTLAPLLQKTPEEASEALTRARHESIDGNSVLITPVKVGGGGFRLGNRARELLAARLPYFDVLPKEVKPFVVELVVEQGSVRAGDLIDCFGLRSIQASRVLSELRDDGLLAVGSVKTVGQGVFYIAGPRFPGTPVPPPVADDPRS